MIMSSSGALLMRLNFFCTLHISSLQQLQEAMYVVKVDSLTSKD